MKINIKIVYASETEQKLIQYEIDSGTTVAQAVSDSGLLKLYPEINIDECQFGIFSKKVSKDSILQDNDRIEIYRPLKISPKEARRLRAELAKK